MTRAWHPRTRDDEAQSIMDQMLDAYVIDEGLFSSLGMLITDALLSADKVTLRKVHDGLRWLIGHHPNSEHRGRFTGQVDVTYWALRRLG